MNDPARRLSRLRTSAGHRWAFGERLLASDFSLATLLGLPASQIDAALARSLGGELAVDGERAAPIAPEHEVWASGVTYLRSRDARQQESTSGDVYQRVYEAERPEIFYKGQGFRVVGSGGAIRIRGDSQWNVPEPELVLVINAHREVIGYTAGNDVSSRDIEGENPLYLPQAKVYDGSCALGPAIQLLDATARENLDQLRALDVKLAIEREGELVFKGETSIARMKRALSELVKALCAELSFPHGVFLMTGTGIVPPEAFTLQVGDHVLMAVGDLELENVVSR